MNHRYDPPVPRMALRLIAAAMAAITMGALVALPAMLETADATAMAQSPSCTPHGSALLPTLFGVDGTHAVDPRAHSRIDT